MKNILIKLAFFLCALVADAVAEIQPASTTQQYPVMIRGKSEVLITKSEVSLADIASINSDNSEAQLSIAKIKICSSPAPGKTLEIDAESVLQALRNNSVNLDSVGYTLFPKINITRASRELNINEAHSVIENLILNESADLKLKQISLPNKALVFTGPISLSAVLKSQSANSRVYTLNLSNSDAENLSIDVRAEVESWRHVPVASRDLPAGTIIEALDFGLARLNAQELNKNTAIDPQQLVGKQLQQQLTQGQAFKIPALAKAIDIKSGSRVVMLYSSAGLLATARGILMQDGQVGDLVEVKNDSSKQIVLGKIKDKSTIEVFE